MKTSDDRSRTSVNLCTLLACFICLFGFQARGIDSAAVKKLFADPPREFSTGPLWVWNDLLTEQQIRETMRDLASQKVKQVWVHPRPGLMTPYLSKDWFRLWRVALDEAARLDMNVWIYDENSYPSGFAGGFVPEAMPESRGRGLLLREAREAPKWSTNSVAVYQLGNDQFEDVSAKVRAGEALPDARFLVASVQRSGNSPWHGGKCYVDLMYPGVTEKFLEITMEPYRREFQNQFGKRLPGVFTDEPNIRPAGGLPWTDGLPKEFEKRWGYQLLEHLPSLSQEIGDWRKIRHNYFQVLLDQFIQHWSIPYHDYCEKYGLEWTGHYWEHDWPSCVGVPDNMAMYAWHQRPAIDTLMNQYREDTHAQFGNARAARELSSVANQLGLKRTLCEVYGAGGWDLRFEDMKRIGDWLEVLGVNTLNQHLSYITIRGARKRDHPQSFSYHEPWWEAYHVSASYLARVTTALTQGEQINSVLLLEPTTAAWMYNSGSERNPRLGEIGKTFQELVLALERAQIEYDIGCEDIIARHGSVKGDAFRVGRRNYKVVVIPPLTDNVNSKTLTALGSFLKGGGTVLCCGEPFARVDGSPSEQGVTLAKNPGWKTLEAGALPARLRARGNPDGFTLQRQLDDKGILFHHRRQLDDGQVLFLVNTSIESPSSGTLEANERGIEKWNLETGKSEAFPFETVGKGVRASFQLPPSGSLMFFLSHKSRKPAPVPDEKLTTLTAAGPPEIRRLEPNVLVLDYVDISAGGESRTNLYFYQAGQFAFKQNGMDRNPWDSAVQFKDELISKQFPANSGFEASYRFVIEEKVPASLSIVIERTDLYTITCNGQPVTARKDAWWLDKAFGRIDIAAVARVGENVVTVKASPFTVYHELESAYVLGDFTLKPTDNGFVIAPDQPIKLGKWNEQGHPFFSKGVAYREQFEVAPRSGRCVVSLPNWYGSVAEVLVNGNSAGYITAPPWECDVTGRTKDGHNTIEVVVIGTLKNTLGPHHNKPALGAAWPSAFQKGPNPGPPPGVNYSTVGYGLFEPFVLHATAR